MSGGRVCLHCYPCPRFLQIAGHGMGPLWVEQRTRNCDWELLVNLLSYTTVDLNWYSRIAQSKHLMKLVVSVWLFSADLSFKRHVQAVSRSSFFQLRQLRNVRHSVDNETAATLICAFVSSRLDYCNSLFSGAPKVVTDVLQNVQNAAARLLLG